MRVKLLLCFLCFSLLFAGCDRIPYITFPVTQTPTSVPTLILQPTSTLPAFPPLEPTPTPDEDFISDPPDSELKYTLQDGGPFYLPNFTHPEQGCAWMGVAGQVFDNQALEVLGLTIVAGNKYSGQESHRSAITGQTMAYGLGGYEILLSDKPVTSSQAYWVQVFDPQGQPLSKRIYFDTFDDCDRNLILVNFVSLEYYDSP